MQVLRPRGSYSQALINPFYRSSALTVRRPDKVGDLTLTRSVYAAKHWGNTPTSRTQIHKAYGEKELLYKASGPWWEEQGAAGGEDLFVCLLTQMFVYTPEEVRHRIAFWNQDTLERTAAKKTFVSISIQLARSSREK